MIRAIMLKKEMMDMLVTLVMLVMMVMERRITNNDLYSKVHTGPKTMMVMWVRIKIRMKKQMRMNKDNFHQDRECSLSLPCSLRQGIVGGSDSSPKLSPEMCQEKIEIMKMKKRVQRDKKCR